MVGRLRRWGGIAGLVVLIALGTAPVGWLQAALSWQTETVDAVGNVGKHTSLALDSAGQPHISYYDDDFRNRDLKYVTFDGTAWQIETVDAAGDVGGYTSLALDSAGRPHISYYDYSNVDLKYATYDGATWQIETVDAAGGVGQETSLALDSAGQPHIGYYDAGNGDLKYASFDGTAWQIETVDSAGDVGPHTSLALDSASQPHIGYYDYSNGALKYATFDGTDWRIETVDAAGSVGWHVSLALDGAGQPHISYGDTSNGNLKYASFDGTSWQIETVDAPADVSNHTSLALDGAGQPHISYDNRVAINTHALKYATFDGTAWRIETVDSTRDVGEYASLALDDTGQPHISYYDGTNADLKYAQLTLNEPPAVEAGGPYSGSEGSPITLQATSSDPENDTLATLWSYEITSADPGTTCAFGDPSQVETTVTCTDDGTVTVTLSADDGSNPAVTDSASVTISNVDPIITDVTGTTSTTQVTITVEATDPGPNDVLSYAFDCHNDSAYEVDAGTTPSTTCPLNPQQEGSFTFGVQVTDDDGGVVTDTVTVTVATALCANDYTGVLRYSETCQSHETAVTIPAPDGPVTICASTYTGLLRLPANGACADHQISYMLPEDGPLSVCVSSYTQTMRVVDDIAQCTSDEFGRVIAATEVGGTPPRTR